MTATGQSAEPVRTIVVVARETELSVRIEAVRALAQAALRRPANWIQLVKFCVVGATGYAVNLGVYALLVHGRGLHYLAAAVLSFVVAVTNNYTWNRLWTFRDQRGHIALPGPAKFLVVSLAALGANLAVLALLVASGYPRSRRRRSRSYS